MLLESLMDSCFSIKSFLSLSVVKLSKDLRSSGEGLNVGSIRFKHKGTDYKDNFSLGRAKGVPSFLSYFKTLSIGPVPVIVPATSRSAAKGSIDSRPFYEFGSSILAS